MPQPDERRVSERASALLHERPHRLQVSYGKRPVQASIVPAVVHIGFPAKGVQISYNLVFKI